MIESRMMKWYEVTHFLEDDFLEDYDGVRAFMVYVDVEEYIYTTCYEPENADFVVTMYYVKEPRKSVSKEDIEITLNGMSRILKKTLTDLQWIVDYDEEPEHCEVITICTAVSNEIFNERSRNIKPGDIVTYAKKNPST